VLLALATTTAMLWMLAGAPWTSLEWTRGLSLRYAQPWWAILPLLAFVGLFPLSLGWYRRTMWTMIVAPSLWAIAMVAFQHADGPFPPRIAGSDLTLAALAGGVVVLGRRWLGGRRRYVVFVTAVIAAAAVGFGVWSADRRDVALAERLRAGPKTDTRGERLYQATLAAERDMRRLCRRRRFFTITRFDEPLSLQGILYTNRVYYAARDVAVTATVAPPIGACDYLITSRDVLDTPKGQALVAALRPGDRLVELVSVDHFLVLGVR
jgi:hypothetical protein